MSTPLRELLLGFGIEVKGKEELDSVDNTVKSLIDKVRNLGAAWLGLRLFEGIGNFLGGTIDAGRSLDLTAEKLGVTVDELERFRFAAGQNGVEVEAADRALMMFNRQLGEAELNAKTAAKGIDKVSGGFTSAQLSAMPLGEMFGHIADHLAGMTDKGAKTELMMKLFSRQGAALIPLFTQGSAGLKKYSDMFDALGGGMGADFAREAKEAGDGIKRLTFTFEVLKTRIVGSVLPWVEKLVGWFTRFIVGLQDIVKHSYAAQTGLIALAAAATIAFAPFLAAILPVVAALTAMYLIFDDIYTMFMGGHSAFGKMLDDIFGEGTKIEFIQAAKEAWQDFLTILRNGWNEIKGIDFKGLFVEFKEPIKIAADLIHVALMELKELLHLISGNPDVVHQRPISPEEKAARETEAYYEPHKKEYGAQSSSFYDSYDAANSAYRPKVVLPLAGMPNMPAHTPVKSWGGMLEGIDQPDIKLDVTVGNIVIQHPNGVDEEHVHKVVADAFADGVSRALQGLPPSPANNAGDGSQGH